MPLTGAEGLSESPCTVILPTYNEEANIVRMVGSLREMYPAFRILIMDDNSKDRTRELTEPLLVDGVVRFFTRDPADRGLSASIFQGIMETDTEFFINMDSDFQHPPGALGPMFEELRSGADLCVGVRADRGTGLSFIRWLGSWGCHFAAVFILRFRGKKSCGDTMSGLFGGRTALFREVVERDGAYFERRGFKALFDLMKNAPADIRISETEYEFGERQGGVSKLSPAVVTSFLRQCGPAGRALARIVGSVLS